MAVLPRRYLDCVFYIYPNREAAEKGERAGGTGFLAARVTAQGDQVFLVTNRHVVDPMVEPYVRLNKRGGGTEVHRIAKSWWRNHPEGDDVSAAQVDLDPTRFQIAWVYRHAFVTPRIIDEVNIGLGEEVVMLGRLATHDGKEENMPSARFGHISILRSDPVENDFGHAQETFVAEYFSIPGYSGSPVFVYVPTTARSEQALENSAYGPWLLGMNWMHFRTRQNVKSGTDGSYVDAHTGMSGVIPAWRIATALDTFGTTS